MKFALLALAALASTALSAPAPAKGSCASECTSPVSFAYKTGTSYVYDYSIETTSALIGVVGDDAMMKISAKAHINAAGPCEFELVLTDVNLQGSTHTSEFAEALTKNHLKFSFQDGVIEHICSPVSEPQWVLNIKRGLLSTFQNTMNYHGGEILQEKDVSGVCETNYKAVSEGNTINVERITNINSCSQRPDFSTFIKSSSYETDSTVQNLPLLKTTNVCHQKIQDDIIIMAECEEVYKSRPFLEERSGAITTVKTVLSLVAQEPIQAVPDYEFFRQSLVYDDEHLEPFIANLEKVNKLLSDLAIASADEIHVETPALFSELVDTLGDLDYPQLSQVYAEATEPHVHKFLVDAMPLVGTPSSTALVRDIIISGELTEVEKDVWFTSLAFIKHPATEMLNAIAPLLESHPSQKALLGISALVNNYCKDHLTCENEPVIKQIVQHIESQLGAGCRTVSEGEKEKVLVALKALGNAGHWVNAKSILETCYTEENDMEVRIAALDAWRHTPCEYDRSNILRLFQDESYDTELRIAAYLSLMTCPTPSVINVVKEKLISESVNQVGSFIWTHMTNLQESATPEKQWIHELIGDEILEKKFSTEALRFSRNYESSFFTNSLNLGGSVESNIIFNSKSYLPRSAMLNLTLDIFGESINFFEVGGRIEGFEAYIERFFGSNGYFPEEHIEQVLRNMRANSNAESTTLEGFLDKISDEPEGSYYMRVFGQELHYHHFQGLENFFMSSASMNPMEFIMEIVRKGKLDYTKSFQLVNTHLNIPTISGMPLIFDSKVTGTFGIEMSSNFMAESFTNFNVEGHLHPSAAIEVDGSLLLDAHVAKTGVMMTATLHTATFLDGKVHIEDGKLVEIAVNSPKDKVEILDVKGDFLYVVDDHKVEKEIEGKKEIEGCTKEILGMALCGSLKYTPYGPFKADIHLEKTGTQTGYVLQFKHDEEKIEFLVDTPGSQSDHKISAIIVRGDHAVNVDIHTPFKSAKGSLEYDWTSLNKKVKAGVTFDSGDQYAFETSLVKTVDDVTIYEPSLMITIPKGEILNIHGVTKTKLDYYDTMLYTKMDIAYLWGSQQTVHLEAETIKHLTDTMSTYTLRGSVDPSQFKDFKASVDMTFSETEHQHYKAQVTAVVKEQTYQLEGKMDNNSIRGKFNVLVDGSLMSPMFNIKANLGIYADSEKATAEFKTVVNGENYDLKFEGTKTSAMLEAHIIRHILLNAHIEYSDNMQKLDFTGEWNKGVDPTAMFLLELKREGPMAMAHIKLLQNEVTVTGTMIDNGVKLEGKFNEKKVTAVINYTMGETKSLSVLLETPIKGLEKQEAAFSITLKEHEITSQIKAAWMNSKQLSLIVIGKLEPGMPNNAMHTEVTFTSSFPKFEHVKFKIDHEMHENSIKTDVIAEWDSRKVHTNFQLMITDSVKASLSFDAPFTKKILITLNHVLSGNDLTSIIEAKYGDKVITANLKGHIVLAGEQDITLALKINVPSPSIPEISATLNYKFDWSKMTVVLEGIMGESKAMLNINGEMTTGESTVVNGDLRFIAPFTYPVTGSLYHKNTVQEFDTKLEMTRFWSDYGSVKFQAEGHYTKPEDVVVSAKLFTPMNKASVDLTHKVTDTNMVSYLDLILNEEKTSISVNGLLDTSKSLANLEASITSTLSKIDDWKVTIESLKNGAERVSKFIFTRNEESFVVDHIIAATDLYNWENTFKINGKYILKNIHSHTGTLHNHDMEYTWESKSVHLVVMIDNKSSGSTHKFDTSVSLDTPWTQVFKIEVHHEDNGIKYKPVIIIEYVPGKKIQLENIIVLGDIFSCESTLKTPFTEDLSYKFTLDLSPRKVAHLLLKWGARQITVDVNGQIQKGKFDSHLEIKSTYLTSPITMEASYDMVSAEKKIHLLGTYGKKFEVTGKLSGDLHNGKWSLISEIPLKTVKHLELTGKWTYEVEHAEIDVHSTVTSFEDVNIFVMYDIHNEKKVDVKLKYGADMIHLTGIYEGETLKIGVTTPFPGWTKMNLNLFVTETAIDVQVFKEDKVVSIKGTMHVKVEKGTINLTLNTPFAGYEEISANLSYSLRGPVKQIKLDASYAAGPISIVGVIDLSKDLAPIMNMEITTPFEIIKKMGGEATWDLRHTLKTADVKAYRNDRQYHWQLEVSSEVPTKGHVKSIIATPFSGWTTVQLEGDFDVTHMPYTFKFVFDKEGVVNQVEGNFLFEDKKINAQLMTPVTGFEKIALKGDFNMEDKHFTGNFEAEVAGDKYQMTIDMILNTSTPKLHITLDTPIAFISKVDLAFESNLVDIMKTMLVNLKINDTIYSAKFEGEMVYKKGYIKLMIQSPVPGFTYVGTEAKYDFTEDVKTAEADFKIEDDSKHFYLKTKVQNNNFHIELHTPFKGFELIKMIGDYTAEHDKHTVLASFEKDHQKYDYNADITLSDYSFSIGLSTPIKVMKNVAVSMKYELFKNGVEGLLHFERNGENYEIKTRGIFTPLKSELLVEVKTPITNWEKLTLDCKYDVVSEKKVASLFVQKDSFQKEITIEGKYTVKSGSFILKTPVPGFEVLGASYTLNLNKANNKLDASVKIQKNADAWDFSVHGEYSPNKIKIDFQTPFDVLKSVVVDGNVDFAQKIGDLNIELGSYKFNIHLSYAVNDMLFKLTTSLDFLKIISFGLKYKWTPSQKDATLNLIYNNYNYVVSGNLNLSPRASEVSLQATTPFPGFNNISLMAKYDVDNKNEIILSKMISDQYEYLFKLGVGIEGTKAHLNWDFTSTFEDWKHVQFVSEINWAADQKTLEVSLGKNDAMKAITVSGKLIGFSEGSLQIHTPFRGIEEMGGYFKLAVGDKLEGKIDLTLPFYLVPTIHVDVNLDLKGKIHGDINLNIAGELYTVKCNLVGASFEEGYNGDLEIYTPIHALSKVILNGNIMIKPWSTLMTHMKADIPSGVYEFDVKTTLALEGSAFHAEVDTTLMDKHVKVILEAKYPSLDNLEGKIVTMFNGKTHKLHGIFNVASNHVVGTFELESPMIGGTKKVLVDISFPKSSYQHVALKVEFVGSASHQIKLELDLTEGVIIHLEADSPVITKFSGTFKITGETAGLIVETPKGVHKMQVSWRVTYQLPADYVFALELASPILPKTLLVNMLLNGDKSNMIFKAELMVGGVRHVIEGSIALTGSNLEFSLNLESPFFNISKATLTSLMSFGSTIKIGINATYNDKVNTFDMVYDKSSKKFHVEVNSPFIPTGKARGEGQVSGEMLKDMQIKMALLNNEQTISGVMTVKIPSTTNMKAILVITTPFKGYKKMKLGAQFVEAEDKIVTFFIEKPVKFNTEIRLKNTENDIRVFLNVETPINDFRKVEGELKIPLKVFGAKVSADVMVGGKHYGGLVTLRTKAPYEIGLGYTVADKYTGLFHIRTDSSFFSGLA